MICATTFASWYMMNGGDLYELAKILGHANIKMTERYAKLGAATHRPNRQYGAGNLEAACERRKRASAHRLDDVRYLYVDPKPSTL